MTSIFFRSWKLACEKPGKGDINDWLWVVIPKDENFVWSEQLSIGRKWFFCFISELPYAVSVEFGF